jgi:putative transposase
MHASNLVHCIFSTKNRANLIANPDSLCRYISGVAKAKHITLLAAGGTANHLHLLISLPPAMPLAQAMRNLKGNSSRMLSEMGQRFS